MRRQRDYHTGLILANDISRLSVTNETDLPMGDQENQKLLDRELKEIGWYDKEIRGSHHEEAVRIWWANELAPTITK